MHGVVRGVRVVFLQLGKLLFKGLGYRIRPFLGSSPFAEAFEFFVSVHTELLLNGAKLAVEVVFPLLLINLLLNLEIDFLLEFGELNLSVKNLEQFHCPGPDVVVLEQVHLSFKILHLHTCGDEIDEERETVNGTHRGYGFLGGYS